MRVTSLEAAQNPFFDQSVNNVTTRQIFEVGATPVSRNVS